MPKYPLTLELPEEGTINLDQRRAVLALKQVKQNNGSVRPSAAWVDLLPVLDRIGLVVEGSLERTTLPEEVVINNTAFHLWVTVKKGGVFSDLLRKKVMGALQRHLDWIGPVYRKPNTESAGSAACLFPHVIVIRPSFRNKKDPVVFSKTLKSLGLVEVRKKSAYLGDFRYFSIATPRRRNAYQLKDIILKRLPNEVESAHYEIMPMESPLAFTPNDPNYFFQWNMDQIEAPRAWDINRGSSATVVAVIDSGCDLGHADLDFSGSGINTSSMGGDGSPTQYSSGALKEHGTNVAGVIAANIDNSLGSAGLAGQCRILPIACPTFTDMEVASAIRYASAEGARIINMSFATAGISFWSGPIPSAIEDAESGGAVLCGATGNGDSEGLVRPAAHPLVMACGGSNRSDERWRFVSPSGVVRGSNYGDSVERGESIGVSVVSPAEDIPTTDITGVAGKVTVPSPAGDYDRYFWMTSAATPHVSGLAALLFSQYSSLTPGQVKRIIERTADKVGSDPYTDVEGYPNGTRNPKMGYGRLNAFKALSLADVMIRDWAGDSGLEPSTPPRGNFYSHSDIVIRPTDDGVFLPDDYDASSRATRSQENFLYVRVVNQGPHVARDVSVDTRITIPRTEFVYPADWTTTGAMHIQPTALDAPIATMAVGDSAIFRFRISVEQVETMFGWTERRWHPCVLAVVNASNDHAFNSATSTGGALIMRRNNLAQRNLSVIGVPEGEMRSMPFMAGSESSGDELFDLVIRIDRLSANDAVYLSFDTDTTFPSLPRQGDQDGFGRCSGQGNWKFIDRTRIETDLCGCRAVLTFEKGSEVDFCHPAPRIVSVKGGKIEAREGVERIRITDTTMVVRYHKASFRAIPLLLQAEIANKLQVDIAQRSLEGKVVGGVVAQFVKA